MKKIETLKVKKLILGALTTPTKARTVRRWGIDPDATASSSLSLLMQYRQKPRALRLGHHSHGHATRRDTPSSGRGSAVWCGCRDVCNSLVADRATMPVGHVHSSQQRTMKLPYFTAESFDLISPTSQNGSIPLVVMLSGYCLPAKQQDDVSAARQRRCS